MAPKQKAQKSSESKIQKSDDKLRIKKTGGVEKIFVSKLKGNEHNVRSIAEIYKEATDKNQYFTIKVQIISAKYSLYEACPKCRRGTCFGCDERAPKTTLLMKFGLSDESGNVLNVTCFEREAFKGFGFNGELFDNDTTNDDKVLSKLLEMEPQLMRVVVKKEIFNGKEYTNWCVSDLEKMQKDVSEVTDEKK